MNCNVKKRDSKFELLRIIIMFGIVIGHYMCHGGVLSNGSHRNQFIASVVSIFGGKTSNDIFIMISTWFLFEKQDKALDKSLLKLIIKTTFFAIFLWSIYTFISGGDDIFETFVCSCEWIWFEYGFIASYILLVIIYPLLNKIVHSVSRLTLQKICLAMLIYISVFKEMYNIHCVLTFMLIYFVISYIKKYQLIDRIKKEWCVFSFIGCSIVIILFEWICHIYCPARITYLIDEENDLLVMINALNMFIFVAKMCPFYNKIINFLAKGIITVYLIHENSLLRPFIWSFFRCEAFYYSEYMIIYSVVCSILIMFLGIAIGIVYDEVEKYIIKIMNKKGIKV